MERSSAAAVLGVCVGLGLAAAGWLLGSSLEASRAQRSVNVKGLAEREVDADLVIWPVAFTETADDLVALQRQVDARRALVLAFLEQAGFARGDIALAVPRIDDLRAERRPDGRPVSSLRYRSQAVVTVRTKDLSLLKKAQERSSELVGQGVALVQDWENRPQYLFTGLNAVKPAMIEEATVAAREAGAKFAKDSGSRLGRIRTASQGLFTVTDRDQSSPDRKVVRVVTTVEYALED